MQQDTGYYVIRKQAVPEVLLKVVEAKKLLDAYKMVEVEAENYTFAVGVTEVTQQLYEAVFEENIFKFKFKLLPA